MSEMHAQARATPHTRAEIKESPASLVALAETYNISVATARKCKDTWWLRRLVTPTAQAQHDAYAWARGDHGRTAPFDFARAG
jgi:hypothetical protein